MISSKEKRKPVVVLLASALFLALQGCAAVKSRPETVSLDTCQLNPTKKLEIAMEDAKSNLSSPKCLGNFDSYYTDLLEVAKGYPKADNSTKFLDYLRWSVNEGYVSKVQAEARYERYFSYKFSSLNSKQSVAAAVCPKLDETMTGLRSELEDKKTGLQDVNGSPAKYKKAQQLYYELELNLEAVCAAVNDSRA